VSALLRAKKGVHEWRVLKTFPTRKEAKVYEKKIIALRRAYAEHCDKQRAAKDLELQGKAYPMEKATHKLTPEQIEKLKALDIID
jgi:hypothetical protein